MSDIAYFRNPKFHFQWIELKSCFPPPIQYSSLLLISICLIFTMCQEIIHCKLYRNSFKEFVHLPSVYFRSSWRDMKRECCKLISAPGVLNVKSFEFSSSTGSYQYPLQASRKMELLAPDSQLATFSTVATGYHGLLSALLRSLGSIQI